MNDAWLIIGSQENWRVALNQPIPLWGLKHSYRSEFANLVEGSPAWLYATRPVGGVIGLATIREKYIDASIPLWPDELNAQRVIWPLRFRLEITKLIPPDRWEEHAIDIRDFGLPWRRGFQRLAPEHARLLAQRFQNRFSWPGEPAADGGPSFVEIGRRVREPDQRTRPVAGDLPLHRRLQELVAEIGRLQHFHSQLEFPIPLEGGGRSLDVVWKREVSGAPTFAFEIELSGAIERAVLRLKFAHDRWNSRPCVVAPADWHAQIRQVLAVQEVGFSRRVALCSADQIEDLGRRKRDLRALEEELGIY